MATDDDWGGDEETRAIDLASAFDNEERDRACVIVLSGSRVGEMVKVDERLVIGRADDATLQVRDEGVSRKHAMLEELADGTVRVTDLSSRNGTFVNGERIETATLSDGDKILLGSVTILKFSYADQVEEVFQRQMYDSALRDPLTTLYNRRFLVSQLEAEFSYSARHQTSLSVVMIDIDHFKSVNDTYGHSTGDHVLTAVGGLLKGAIRTEDLAARYGGEEFCIVCRGIPATIAENVTNRLRRVIEAEQLISDDLDRKITISAGVASVPDPRIQTADALLAAADEALYEAKRTGRNRVCVNEPPDE